MTITATGAALAAAPRTDDMLRDAVARVASSGTDLGTGVLAGPGSAARSAIPHGVPPADQARARRAGMDRPEVAANKVAARGAAAAGRQFEGRYGGLGFLLANPDQNKARHSEMLDDAKAAPTDELQAVLRAGGVRLKAIGDRETAARVEQMIVNYPKAFDLRIAAAPGKTRDQVVDDIREDFGRFAFDKQRALSTPPGPGGRPHETPGEEKMSVASLHRGYKAVAAILNSRGVVPEVSMKGAATSKLAEAVAAPVPTARFVRGGRDLG